LITGDASGEVVGVHLARRKRRPFPRFVSDFLNPILQLMYLLSTLSWQIANSCVISLQSVYRAYLEELDHDTSLLPKEHEPKDVTSVENSNNSGVLDKSQVNTCTDKSLDTSTSEKISGCKKNDEDACTSKETSTSEEKKIVLPPTTAAEVFKKHRLVFHDVNAVSSCNNYH